MADICFIPSFGIEETACEAFGLVDQLNDYLIKPENSILTLTVALRKVEKALIAYALISIALLGSLSIIYFIKKPSNDYTLYYSETCPHCKIVEEYITNNSLQTKLQITEKEVSKNQPNLLEMKKRMESCGDYNDTLSVPFMYHLNKCYTSQDEIINLLSQKIQGA